MYVFALWEPVENSRMHEEDIQISPEGAMLAADPAIFLLRGNGSTNCVTILRVYMYNFLFDIAN